MVYSDGACSGNPGPGGWAWVEVDGAWQSGFDAETTNQRMELSAALGACEHFDGPLVIVSDSTYVVNCWRDRWWEGWLRRGWVNSAKKPVANRDLWERLVPHFRDRPDLQLRWVKGHSGDRWNDIADRLAVAAVQRRVGASGSSPPTEDDLGDEDLPTSGSTVAGAAGSVRSAPADVPTGQPVGGRRSEAARERDGRVPAGFLVAVTGLRTAAVASAEAELARIVKGWAEMHPDTVVLTGLRAGAEELAVAAAGAAGVPYAVVLPYPDPTSGWPEQEQARFAAACDGAVEVVTLERKRPVDADGRRTALARRDGWLRSVTDVGIVLSDGRDPEAEAAVRQWETALGDDVWRLDVVGST